jgi:hypothetical protein
MRLALSTTRNLRSWGGTAGNPEELVTTRRRHCARRSGSARPGQRSRESRESRSGWQQYRTSNDSSRPAIPMVNSTSRRKHRERGATDLTLRFPSHHRQCTPSSITPDPLPTAAPHGRIRSSKSPSGRAPLPPQDRGTARKEPQHQPTSHPSNSHPRQGERQTWRNRREAIPINKPAIHSALSSRGTGHGLTLELTSRIPVKAPG